MIKNISNLGDAALYCDFGKEVNEEINSYVISYFDHLKKLVEVACNFCVPGFVEHSNVIFVGI